MNETCTHLNEIFRFCDKTPRERLLIAPSILAADFSKMGEEIKNITEAGADLIHYDVMDGVFVPNITFGIKMLKDIKAYSSLPFDAHLMIVEPWKYVERFAEAGADIISVHYKACRENLIKTLKQISACGKKAGLAINPDVPLSEVSGALEYCDMLLIMSVYPGFGGQKFIEDSLQKIQDAKKAIAATGKNILIETDGGINAQTATAVKLAGADIAVAGSAVFGSPDRRKEIDLLKNA